MNMVKGDDSLVLGYSQYRLMITVCTAPRPGAWPGQAGGLRMIMIVPWNTDCDMYMMYRVIITVISLTVMLIYYY